MGDAVVFNRRIRPRYLEHELATITELDPRWVTVRLARPVGRFRDGELRCPPWRFAGSSARAARQPPETEARLTALALLAGRPRIRRVFSLLAQELKRAERTNRVAAGEAAELP